MTQDEVKIVCQGTTPWKTGIILWGRVELFTRGWARCCWVSKRYDAGWSEDCIPRCNTLKNGNLPGRKGWALSRRVSELLLIPKEAWSSMKWKFYVEVQRPIKRASSWEEGLSFLQVGEWAGAESQRGMMQRKRRMITRQTKEIEKESINIIFDAT